MIRLAEFKDKSGLITLWNEAFGDSIDSIEFFLNRRFNPQSTVVCEENGKIVSMLFLLDGKVFCENILFSAYYLYAAATLKSYRGRGIMADMLEFSKKFAREKGVDLICLKPANDNLYDYYEMHGYKTVFSTKTVSLCIDSRKTSPIIDADSSCDYFEARENAFKNYGRFIWDKNAVDFAVDFHKYFGGSVLERRKGYVLYTKSDANCTVNEFTFTPDVIADITSIVATKDVTEAKIILPVDYPVDSENYFISRNGMALATSEKGFAVYAHNNLYLNLTLD